MQTPAKVSLIIVVFSSTVDFILASPPISEIRASAMSSRAARLTAEASCAKESGFLCLDGLDCVKAAWVCDGEEDCLDGSDERACGVRDESVCAWPNVRCTSSFFESQCVPFHYHCDGIRDCYLGEDEEGCPSRTTHPDATHRMNTAIAESIAGDAMRRCAADTVPCLRRRHEWSYSFDSSECLDALRLCDGRSDCHYPDDETPLACALRQTMEQNKQDRHKENHTRPRY